jgi:crossover junction endodeoxyribonuclease RuvC
MSRDSHLKLLTAGIDISLCSTGIIVLDGKNIVREAIIKSKPMGDSYRSETIRLSGIMNSIENTLVDLGELVNFHEIELVVIEGMAFAVRQTVSVFQLAALHYGTRMMLEQYGKKVIVVAPSQLKKFVTLKGTSHKSEILLEVYKRYGVSFSNEDLADAYGLAVIGRNLLIEDKVCLKQQHEVLDALRVQLDK